MACPWRQGQTQSKAALKGISSVYGSILRWAFRFPSTPPLGARIFSKLYLLRQGPFGPSLPSIGLFIIRCPSANVWSANVNSTRRNDSVVKSSRRRRWRHSSGLNDNQETASLSFRGRNLWNPWYCRTPDNLPYQPHPLDPTSKVSLAILVAPIRLLEKNSKKKSSKDWFPERIVIQCYFGVNLRFNQFYYTYFNAKGISSIFLVTIFNPVSDLTKSVMTKKKPAYYSIRQKY